MLGTNSVTGSLGALPLSGSQSSQRKCSPLSTGELQNGEETNGDLGRAASQDRAAILPIATWKAGFVQTSVQLLPSSCWGGLGTAAHFFPPPAPRAALCPCPEPGHASAVGQTSTRVVTL